MSTVNDHNEGSNDFTVGDVDVVFSIKHGAAPSESLKRFALTTDG